MKKIKSITDAIDIADKSSLSEFWPEINSKWKSSKRTPVWFRGECAEYDFPITPEVFRNDKSYYYEGTMYEEFKLRSQYSNEPRSTFNWLCQMQHYGLPTRLLDWTSSILVALFFATKNFEQKENGILFILNPLILNDMSEYNDSTSALKLADHFGSVSRAILAKDFVLDIFLENNELKNCDAYDSLFREEIPYLKICNQIRSIYHNIQNGIKVSNNDKKTFESFIKKNSMPCAIDPKGINRRMIAQQSKFTLHGGNIVWKTTDSEGEIVDNSNPEIDLLDLQKNSNRFIEFCEIPHAYKQKIHSQLDILGIHEASLFPEADRLSTYIKSKLN